MEDLVSFPASFWEVGDRGSNMGSPIKYGRSDNSNAECNYVTDCIKYCTTAEADELT